MIDRCRPRLKHLNWPWLLVMAVLTAGLTNGCGRSKETHAASPPALPQVELSDQTTEESLRQYVGKKIVVSGLWEDAGKPGSFIHGPDRMRGERIFIESRTDAGLGKMNKIYQTQKNGSPLHITGVLCLFDPGPLPADQQRVPVQTLPKHFYFDVEESDFAFGDAGAKTGKPVLQK
jgi:hypothetical protein